MLKMQRKKFSTLGQTFTVPNHTKNSKATTYVPWCPSFLECFPAPSHFPLLLFFFIHTLVFLFIFFLGRFCPPPLKPTNLMFTLLFFPFCSHFCSLPGPFSILSPPEVLSLPAAVTTPLTFLPISDFGW